MGFGSGSTLMDRVIEAAKAHIPRLGARRDFYTAVIAAFEDHDWDCQSECEGTDAVWDSALRDLHPEEE